MSIETFFELAFGIGELLITTPPGLIALGFVTWAVISKVVKY